MDSRVPVPQSQESQSRSREEIDRRSIDYFNSLQKLLFDLLCDVISVHKPAIVATLKGEHRRPTMRKFLHTIEARGIWFQLLSIIEQNTTVRHHREVERFLRAENNSGTFAELFAETAALGISAETVNQALARARVEPVITAHPTEAKRITVLRIHRRIYVLLKRLESERWTPREREGIAERLRHEIELLWTSGEIRMEKPTVYDEINWGMHFFSTSLYEACPAIHQSCADAFRRHYPNKQLDKSSFLQFGSWIGGDRDGNPFVDSKVSEEALYSFRLMALKFYRKSLRECLARFSIASRCAGGDFLIGA